MTLCLPMVALTCPLVALFTEGSGCIWDVYQASINVEVDIAAVVVGSRPSLTIVGVPIGLTIVIVAGIHNHQVQCRSTIGCTLLP